MAKGTKRVFTSDKDTETETEAPKGTDDHSSTAKKIQSAKVRILWTFILLGGFLIVLSLGNNYCAIMVITIIGLLFKELLSLKRNTERENEHRIPRFYMMSWYFFVLTVAYLIPRFLPDETELKLFSEPTMQALHNKSPLTLFIAFVLGILMFTLSLEKGIMRYQFKMLAWTIVLLIIVVAQVSSIIYNVYTGLFWFIFPCMCVVTNDCFAYAFGMLFG